MNLKQIPRLLEGMKGRRVLVVGDAVLDEYLYGTTERVSREAPVPIVRFDQGEQRLGGAANAARNVVALGGSACMAAVIGRDDKGRALLRALRAADIDPASVVHERGRHTLTKLRVLAGAPGTHKQQMLRVDRQPDAPPRPETRRALASAVGRASRRSDAILVSDYGDGALDGGLIRRLARAGQRRPVVIDSRYQLAAFRGPFYLKPNAPELAVATGMPTDDARAVVRAARALRDRTGARAVLTTRGRAGMCLVGEGRVVRHQPIIGGEDVTDVTGAGDTVAAAISLALASGADVVEAMILATIAAGIVVQKPGAATASPEGIRAVSVAGGEA